MQMTEETGMSLVLQLAPQDAELLRAAMPTGNVHQDALGITPTRNLVQAALAAVARAVLRGGYQPQTLAAELRPSAETDRGPLPPGVVVVHL
jgi:hypothetical protein